MGIARGGFIIVCPPDFDRRRSCLDGGFERHGAMHFLPELFTTSEPRIAAAALGRYKSRQAG